MAVRGLARALRGPVSLILPRSPPFFCMLLDLMRLGARMSLFCIAMMQIDAVEDADALLK